MKKIEFEELTKLIDPIVAARDNWFLVSAGKDKNVNCLTAGWFGLGNVWEKKVATIYIRPQRHTKKFIDETGRFTLTFFENQKDALVYLGSHSGKDVPNKIEESGLHLIDINGDPTYEEAKYTIVCKVLYKNQINVIGFIDSEFANKTYPDKDYSVEYIGEIEAIYEN